MKPRVRILKGFTVLASLTLCVALAACGDRDRAVVGSPAAQSKAEIAWFAGSVQEAFAEAKATNRPVFLFWGAAWCPYCQQLKSSVFTRRDFIEKSRLFIPVYLDGDEAGAQKWGETLKVSGYPTVLILRPDGTELMRVAGGLDVERYTELLDLALADTRPVAEILAGLPLNESPMSAEDCRRLAFHGFSLETEPVADEAHLATQLDLAAKRCPPSSQVERDRLVVQAATLGLSAEGAAIREGKAPSSQTATMLSKIIELLADNARAVAVADTLFVLDDRFFTATRRGKLVPDDKLQQRWFDVMDRASVDPRYSESDQFFALTAKLQGAKAFGALTPQLASDARAKVDAALARKHDAYTRASVVNSLLYVMDALDDQDRVYAIAEQEMQSSATPYYYMLDLAGIDEKRGRFDAALGWFERAYLESRGPATRFQWGTSYVASLIRMRPQDDARIRDTTLAVLAELDGPDRLYQRTNARIERLERELAKWNADGSKSAAIAAVQARMQQVCSKIPDAESEAKAACAGFLKSAAAVLAPAAPAAV
ncbi:MAG: thioredoxin family protein [Steroidobacteraceae bacterium]